MEEMLRSFNTDIDGVILDGLAMIDSYVLEIDEIASDLYRKILNSEIDKLIKLRRELEEEQKFGTPEMEELIREINSLEEKKRIHYIHKNMVLEEALPEYVGRIPYKDIYVRKNVYDGVVDTLYKIKETGIFPLFFAPTVANPASEIVAKNDLFADIAPFVKVVAFKFFVEPFFVPGTRLQTPNRIPCDKAVKFSRSVKNIYIPESVIVDDTLGVCESAKALGFNVYHVDRDNPYVNVDTNVIYIQATNDIIRKVGNDKIKELSL